MPLIHLNDLAAALPMAWRSRPIAALPASNVKVVRMDDTAYGEETHEYDELLLVVSGTMHLIVDGQTELVGAGNLYVVPAGVSHAVGAGSHGTLLILDPAHA